jgi:glycosyltransferase involved in cell wall biosynthesis
MTSAVWAILTGEYPPTMGGVSDYSRQVAVGLARRGQEVHVFSPQSSAAPVEDESVTVHELPDHFGIRSLPWLSRELDRLGSPRILVEYVPHAFGMRAMNLPLCLWSKARASRNSIRTMFHEVSYPFESGQPMRHQLLAGVNRIMAMLVASASERVFVSIPQWQRLLEDLGVDANRIETLPIPSNVPLRADPAQVAQARRIASSDGELLVGHFGTYGPHIIAILEPVLPSLLRSVPCRVLLMGRNSDAFAQRLGTTDPATAGRITATGALDSDSLASHLAACDLLVQVYPDGISGRRGTTMAALALGVPVVSNLGPLSEDFWRDSGAVALADSPDPAAIVSQVQRLIADESHRRSLGCRGRRLYAERFDIEHTIDTLLRPG